MTGHQVTEVESVDKPLCIVDGCSKQRNCRGMCQMHYVRWRKYGSPHAVWPSRRSLVPCAVPDCIRMARARGWCSSHYSNWKTYGSPIAQRNRTLKERIREIGWTVTYTGCWEWNGSRNEHGYGIINVKRLGLKGARAHRVVYKHLFGHDLSDAEELRHRCDNPPCVNPRHLIPGTHAENVADMMERGRHYRHGATMCRNGLHDLTKPGAVRSNDLDHVCAECHRESVRRDNERRREYKNEWRRKKRGTKL